MKTLMSEDSKKGDQKQLIGAILFITIALAPLFGVCILFNLKIINNIAG
jgi:hypothetical protein